MAPAPPTPAPTTTPLSERVAGVRPDTGPRTGAKSRTDAPGEPRQPAILPEVTVKRLTLYLRALAEASTDGQATTSSEALAARAGVNAAQVRKDLSYLGSFGTRGVGYDVDSLCQHINRHLGLNREYRVALVGAGNLGRALAGYRGFAERGFRVVAAFDSDPEKVGRYLGDIEIHPVSALEAVVRQKGITMALLASPAGVAQEVAERLAAAGVTSVLNFAPIVLNLGSEVCVRRVDLAVELQVLSYFQNTLASAQRRATEPSACP
jgi:redox-sensing transcriptional repressor